MHELTLTRRFNAPPARVFAAWTQPELMARWLAPGTMSVSEARSDLRIGGAWRVVMQEPDGQRRIVGGVYREISATRLCFSWCWEGSEVTSQVDISLRADGSGTEMTLHHHELESATSRDKHGQGWQACLAKLPALFN